MSVATLAVATRRGTLEAGDGPDVPDEASGTSASGAAPAVQTEADRLEALGDRICRLSAHLDAGHRELLALVAEFDRLRGWKVGGHRSCAKWLSLRTGRAPGRAREQVRVARALEELPRTGEAMGRGRLSFDQVRTVTRVADAETEDDLLELAEGATITQLQRMARAWKKGTRQDEAARERAEGDGSGAGSTDRSTEPPSPRARRREAARRRAAETARRLACDASRVDVLRGADGEVLDVGRKRRTVSPALRRALEVRDRGCRFPGCGLRFTDAHHVTH